MNFFDQTSRSIVAFLRTNYKPTDTQLAAWLAHPGEIDQRVKGTEFEAVLSHDPEAAAQRAGILATLSAFADEKER
jgi:hypothetical protein